MRVNEVFHSLLEVDFEEWFTEFFEGDGTAVSLDVHTSMCNFYRPLVRVIQKEPEVLVPIHERLGGRLYKGSGAMGWLCEWDSQKRSRSVLEILSNHLVASTRVEQVNKLLLRLSMNLAVKHSVTPSWLVGFWDAEGWSTLNTRTIKDTVYTYLAIGLAQKSSEVLIEVKTLLGCGNVYFDTGGSGVHSWQVQSRLDAVELGRCLVKFSQNPYKCAQLQYNLELVTREASDAC